MRTFVKIYANTHIYNSIIKPRPLKLNHTERRRKNAEKPHNLLSIERNNMTVNISSLSLFCLNNHVKSKCDQMFVIQWINLLLRWRKIWYNFFFIWKKEKEKKSFHVRYSILCCRCACSVNLFVYGVFYNIIRKAFLAVCFMYTDTHSGFHVALYVLQFVVIYYKLWGETRGRAKEKSWKWLFTFQRHTQTHSILLCHTDYYM